MKIKETKVLQELRLEEISNSKEIDYDSLKSLLDSVRTKKLHKRNNYHQQKINDIIEKATK
jgi:Cft2 family RNA processing exonuclease